MLIDHRTYTFYPGKLQVFLSRFEQEGLPLQIRYCGNLIGYFTTETGVLNQVIQLWAYADAADRDARRASLWVDPAWKAFGEWALPLIQHQESRLLKPTAFSPRLWAP
jgi:hypothetical protein